MTTSPKRFWLLLVAIVGVLSLVAAACGDDDDDTTANDDVSDDAGDDSADDDAADDAGDDASDDTGDDAADDTGDDAETLDPVTIAFLTEETGSSAIPLHSVMQALVDDINANGGLNGHPIETALYDTAGDVAEAQAAVAEFPDDVIAVLIASPSTEVSVGESLSALGVPVMGVGYQPGVWSATIFGTGCAENPGFCALPNFLTTTTTMDAIVATQLVNAQRNGATKVQAASCAEVDSCVAADPIFTGVAGALGLDFNPAARVATTAADYISECIGFIQDDVDFIQLGISDFAGITLMQDCVDQGYDGLFGSSGGAVSSDLIAAAADGLNGGLNGFPWFVDDPAVQNYRDIMADAGVDEGDWGHAHATAMAAALWLLEKGIADHADPAAALDGAAALAAMYMVDGETLGGLLPQPATFTADNLDRTVGCYFPYLKADGVPDNPLGGLTAECWPPAG